MTSLQEAKEILGENNVFGPEDWLKHFAGKVSFTEAQLTQVAQVPWSTDVLRRPGLNLPHFLFLGVEECFAGPLTLVMWHKLLLPAGSKVLVMPSFGKGGPNPIEVMEWKKQSKLRENASNPKFMDDHNLGGPFVKETCGFRWYLMPVGLVLAKPPGIFRSGQNVPNTYEVANVIERVTGNIVYSWQTGQYLDTAVMVCTRSHGENGHEILISGINSMGEYSGLDVYEGTANPDYKKIGFAASRKI